MIKGVNREIIEISDTGHNYFERAVLYIRPGNALKDSKEIALEANRYIKSVCSGDERVDINALTSKPVVAVVSATIGSILTYIVMILS